MNVTAGVLIGNRFRLRECIGVSGLGRIWRASERVPGKEAAIRFLDEPIAGTFAAIESQAAHALALRHRALARIQEVGRLPDGSTWIATEFATGESLEGHLDERGRLPRGVALALFRELACALADVHRNGIVHRGVSAENVLVQRTRSHGMRPRLVALDRAVILASQVQTRAPVTTYSSPEVVAAGQYSAASDIWALGVLLFRCVQGRFPFVARTAATFAKEARAVHRVLPTIEDEGVRGLVEQCLAFDPNARPTAAALIDQADLAASIGEPEVISAPLAPPAAAIAPEVPAPMLAPPPVETLPQLVVPPVVAVRRQRPAAMVILVAFAAASCAGWIALTHEPRPGPPRKATVKATSAAAKPVASAVRATFLLKPCE